MAVLSGDTLARGEKLGCAAGYDRYLFSGSKDCKVKCWDIEKEKCVDTWRLANSCDRLWQANDGVDRLLYAATPSSIHVIDFRVKALCTYPAFGMLPSSLLCVGSLLKQLWNVEHNPLRLAAFQKSSWLPLG